MRSQAEKARLFREMHARPGILILPNPWDAGTAKLLASLGFEALATTSLGMAIALGRADGARAAGAVYLRRTGGKPDPRQARPRRYDQAPAGLREGRRRCAVRARAAR